jgi:hypothetical protein
MQMNSFWIVAPYSWTQFPDLHLKRLIMAIRRFPPVFFFFVVLLPFFPDMFFVYVLSFCFFSFLSIGFCCFFFVVLSLSEEAAAKMD